jgi:hypothetical protein
MPKISRTEFHSITKKEINYARRGPKEKAFLMKKVVVDDIAALTNRFCLHIPLHGAGLNYGPLEEAGTYKSIFSFANNILNGNRLIAKEKLWWAGLRDIDPKAQSALQDHYLNMFGSMMLRSFDALQNKVGSGDLSLLEITLSKFKDAQEYILKIPTPELTGVSRLHIMEVTGKEVPADLQNALKFMEYKVWVYPLALSRMYTKQRHFLAGRARATFRGNISKDTVVIGNDPILNEKAKQKGAMSYWETGISTETNLLHVLEILKEMRRTA